MDPLATCSLFEQFLAQRRYLRNVTPSTIEWYQTAFKALQRAPGPDVPPLTKSSLQQFVVSVRQRGVKPVSCNTYIKALNAFCLWLHEEGHLAVPLQLPLLKVEQRIVQTLSDPSMQALLSQKPKRFVQWRLHALLCLLLDAGLRIEQVPMKTQLIRIVAGLAVLLFFLPFTASPNNSAWANPFQMRVVDQTGHGLSHVKLTSDNGIVCYTRADGSVLWSESSLMDRDVNFRIEAPGAPITTTVRVVEGGHTEVAIPR